MGMMQLPPLNLAEYNAVTTALHSAIVASESAARGIPKDSKLSFMLREKARELSELVGKIVEQTKEVTL